MTEFYDGVYFSASTVARYRASDPSDGMLKPVRGEKLKPLSVGPSCRQERLNCWLKRRRQ